MAQRDKRGTAAPAPLAPRLTISIQRWAITARVNAMFRVLWERNLKYESNQVKTLENCALQTRVALKEA